MSFEMIYIIPEQHLKTKDDARSLAPDKVLAGIDLPLFPVNALALIIGDEIHWPATDFLTDIGIFGKGITGDTVRTYGEALICYLNFLRSADCSLSEVSEYWIQTFRNNLNTPKLGLKNLSHNTINLRLTIATQFHIWGELYKKFSSPLGRFLLDNRTSRSRPFHKNHHKNESNLVRTKFSLSVEKKIPRILNSEEIKQLVNRTPLPFSLMFKWAVVTGMRRLEICSLKISDLPVRLDSQPKGLREIEIRRKGGKQATVYVPNALIDETWWYIFTTRAKPKSNEDYLFLSSSGYQISRQYLSSAFKKYVKQIAPSATLHHLRHTYAVLTLTILQRRADLGDSINPLKTLQVLLGHSSIESTEIYLRALDIHSSAVEEALNYLYGAEI